MTATLAGLAAPALGQVAGSGTPLPPTAEPVPPVETPLPGGPRGIAPGIVVPSLGGAAPAGAEAIAVTVTDLRFEGVTAYDPATLDTLWAELRDRTATLADIFAVAETLQDRYRADGFFLTRVLVPAQTAEDGRFTIRAIEGYVAEIEVTGDVGPVAERVRAYLGRVTDERPLRLPTLERALLLSNDLPGLFATATLSAAQGQVGASVLRVALTRDLFTGSFAANNRGSRFSGPLRFITTAQLNSLTSLGDELSGIAFVTSQTEEQRFGQLGYSFRVGDDGLQISLTGSYGPSEPGFTLEALDVDSRGVRASVVATYPLIRSRRYSLAVAAGIELQDSDTDLVGVSVVDDQLRIVTLGAIGEAAEFTGGRVRFETRLQQGLDAFGASGTGGTRRSRIDGDPEFTVLTLDASRSERVTNEIEWLTRVSGQYAFEALLADAEFRAGGEAFGRGYNPSEIAGDSGVGLSTDLIYTFETDWQVANVWQLYAFYDFAAVWNIDGGMPGRQTLQSLGVGVRNEILSGIILGVEAARPLTRNVSTGEDSDPARLFFSLSATY